MPRRDGRGPLGQGAMAGQGLGTCYGGKPQCEKGGERGQRGLNCKRNSRNCSYSDAGQALTQQKEALQARIDAINEKLSKA